VGIDDTPRRCNQTYISSTATRVAAAAQGRDKGALCRLCDQLKEHLAVRGALTELTCDIA